jgi:hypothetical protein
VCNLEFTPPASVDLITYYRELDEILEKMKRSIENRGAKQWKRLPAIPKSTAGVQLNII